MVIQSPNIKEIKVETSFSLRDGGRIEAVYVRFSSNKVATTKENEPGLIMVDYDKHGVIVGVEILAPLKISELDRFFPDSECRPAIRRVLAQSTPDFLLTG